MDQSSLSLRVISECSPEDYLPTVRQKYPLVKELNCTKLLSQFNSYQHLPGSWQYKDTVSHGAMEMLNAVVNLCKVSTKQCG